MRTTRASMMIAGLAMAAAASVTLAEPPKPEAERPKKHQAPAPRPAPRGAVRLNRSRHWDYAATYAEARAQSPYPHRPVR